MSFIRPGRDSTSPIFFTTFPANENPVSEGGYWIRNAAGWQSPQTSGGRAFTPLPNLSFDDAYRYIDPAKKTFGTNYKIEATIFKAGGYAPGGSHEVELLLRMTDSSSDNRVHGYEINLAHGGGYSQIMKWDGLVTDTYYTSIGSLNNPINPVAGDVLRADVIGTTINVYLVQSGVPTLMNTATDATFATGQPGMGYFMDSGGTNTSYCLDDFRVTPL